MAFRYFEFAEEAVPGTAETTAEMTCDPMSVSPGIPNNPDIDYKGGIGRGRTIHRPGPYSTSPSYEGGVDVKMLARFLYFVLGNKVTEVTEGSTGPDVSTEYIYPTDSIMLPSFTGFFGIDNKEYVIPGIVADKLELSADKDFLVAKLDMQGMGEVAGDIKTEAELTKNADYPLAFFEVDVHMRDYGSVTAWGSGTLISSDVKKLAISFENSAKADDGFGVGSRFPYKIPAGERTIGMKFDADYLEQTWYDLLQGAATGPQVDDGATEFEMLVRIDAGTYGSIDIEFPRVIVVSAPLDAKGRDVLTQSIEIAAYQDDYSLPTTPATAVFCEAIVKATLNFTDSTVAFDGPAWADEE